MPQYGDVGRKEKSSQTYRTTLERKAHLPDDNDLAFRLRFGLEEVDLSEATTTVGRDPSCSVSIEDDLVSRTHAVFRRFDDFVEATDLGSRNGTRVNGVAIRGPTRLRHGDRIRIGSRDLVFYDTSQDHGRERRQSATGKMVICDRCGEAVPGEAPTCSRCGTSTTAS